MRVVAKYIRQRLRHDDFNTVMMLNELLQLIHGLPSGLPRLNELRYRTPLVKAQTILFHLNRQRWASIKHPTTRTPKTERTFAIRLLSLCIASELLAPAVCSAPMYLHTQVCQGLYAELWKRELKVYEVENGRGGMVRTIVYNARPWSLQSSWTVRRLYEMVAPCYREWYMHHEEEIKGSIPAMSYTRTVS